jgi:hypothetical protein
MRHIANIFIIIILIAYMHEYSSLLEQNSPWIINILLFIPIFALLAINTNLFNKNK